MNKILIIKSKKDAASELVSELEYEGYEVKVDSHDELLNLIKKDNFSALILFTDSGDMELISDVRKLNFKIPIIVISESANIQDKIYAFNLGADDYIQIPFSEHEVLARTKAHIRKLNNLKKEEQLAAVIYSDNDYSSGTIGDSKVYFDRLIIKRGDEEIFLTNKEAGILQLLYKNRGKVVTREDLIKEVWNGDTYITERVIDTNVVSIRKKLNDTGKKPKYIKTVFGVGYKLVDEE
ncbi:MAG: response regulator transcription factor [Brevinematales bacterium]|nr:response regulator transcription factor [Brevinematales bacterium]